MYNGLDMEVVKSNLSSTKLELVITAKADELQPIKQKVLRHQAHHVKPAGFRPGKAPLNVVEKHLDPAVLQTEFLDEAVNHFYFEAMRKDKIRPVAPPKIELKKFVPFTELEFSAEVEVVGEIKLANYKSISVDLKPVKVTEEDVKEILDRLSKQAAKKTEVERAAENGDEAWIDFTGKNQKGEPVKGADGKDYPLVLGSKSFIPGFEDNVVGLKPGDKKEFKVKFPADYQVAALQNKNVTFEVKVNKIQQLDLPEIDDDFAKQVGPFNNLDELKADIKKQIEAERGNQAKRQHENELVGLIVEKSTFEIPDILVEEQIDRLEEEEKRNLTYRGQTWQEHLDEEGITAEQHRERKRESALNRVRGGLVLSEIAELEGLKVTPEELEIRIQILKGQYQDGSMQAELDKPENRRDVEAQLLTEKTLNILLQN